jgi:peptidyl-tRNA hydrolase
MKMYIVVKEDVPAKFVPVICSHASLSAYLRYQNDELVQEWLKSSFKKVVCKVSNEEFEKCKSLERSEVITESALENKEVACVLLPRPEFPKFIKFLKLYNI